jgi:hypothetical protein
MTELSLRREGSPKADGMLWGAGASGNATYLRGFERAEFGNEKLFHICAARRLSGEEFGFRRGAAASATANIFMKLLLPRRLE